MATTSAARRRAARGHGPETRRDVAATAGPPPAPRAAPRRAPVFVVQTHAARRRHWDFRLEHDGVLWSWAVPKGPSLDPGDKRLAVHVEDHPLDDARFQGRIPAGRYGAGTVETWDRGTWHPVGDPAEGMRRGELKFTLAGERLRGGFVLVRLEPRGRERAETWLLIKQHDATQSLLSCDERLRFSDHVDGQGAAMRRRACALGPEGIVCKPADAPYAAGRGHGGVKVNCRGQEKFVVLGWTPRSGRRTGLGASQVGFSDPAGALHYAGGVGTGFTERELGTLRAPPAAGLHHGEEPPAREVVRDLPDPDQSRRVLRAAMPARIVRPRAAQGITHAGKELWPGITKGDLATYWRAVAAHALPDLAGRPLALLRCPDGIDGPRFFQKHGHAGMPAPIRAGDAGGAPFLAIDDLDGLLAVAQVAAIELHAWGASGTDPLHPDRLVFDLDPGEGVTFADVVAAAKDVRARLAAQGLGAFCRTSGGKGLHVVVPLVPGADWTAARAWSRRFAERMAAERPDRYVASVPKARRRGHILVDWLRNGLGATAVACFSPRARPGAMVATPLAWREVTALLDPARFTLRSVPARLHRQRRDPWQGFAAAARPVPEGDT